MILEERDREPLREGYRWYDFTRTVTLVEGVKKYNNDAKENIKAHHIIRPIL
jgi:hypothetical protein